MSCGLGRRHRLDVALLWLWHRMAAAGQIRSLAWEHPYAMGVAQKRQKKKKKKKDSESWGPFHDKNSPILYSLTTNLMGKK